MNAKMPELKQAFESAGFTDVKTILSSGNVAFNARAASDISLQHRAEAAMLEQLGQAFLTIVRPVDALRDLLASDPYRPFRLDPTAKRIVTFLRDKPPLKLKLPIERDGARILLMKGREVFSAYVRSPKGPVFMALIEQALGKDVTTRTWETVGKVARA
jgi:uncharacterized protein (DUF1697 family)